VSKRNTSKSKKNSSNFVISKNLISYLCKILYSKNLISTQITSYNDIKKIQKQISNKIEYFTWVFISEHLKFFIQLSILFFLLLIPKKLETNRNITLVYGLSHEQIFFKGSSDRLLDFLMSAKIDLAKNDLFYIQNARRNFFDKKIDKMKFCSNIPISVYFDFLDTKNKIRVIYLIVKRMFVYFKLLKQFPFLHQILQPFVLHEVIFDFLQSHNYLNFIDLVSTPSIIKSLPYVFERNLQLGSRLMIWYSANSIPINYKSKSLRRVQDDEKIYKTLPIDKHLVWSDSHKHYLESILDPGASVKVCGSLMFYLPSKNLKAEKVYDLLIFDVTPYSSKHKDPIHQLSFNKNSIYTASTTAQFIDDLLWVARRIENHFKIKLRIAVKPKRRYSSLHDYGYIDYLNLMSRHKFIEILGPESDLYSIIYASKICVSFPFSSPSIIARELGVPTVYYLGDDSIEKYDLVHGVGFINNKFDLFDFMLSQKIIEFE